MALTSIKDETSSPGGDAADKSSLDQLTDNPNNKAQDILSNNNNMYINTLHIATTIAAAMSNKNSHDSFLHQSWTNGDTTSMDDDEDDTVHHNLLQPNDCHNGEDVDHQQEDIDIDGEENDFDDTPTDDEDANVSIDGGLTHPDVLTGPYFSVLNHHHQHSVSSPSSSTNTHISQSSSLFSNSGGGTGTCDIVTSTHSSPTCPTHTIDAILGLRNLQQQQQLLQSHQQSFQEGCRAGGAASLLFQQTGISASAVMTNSVDHSKRGHLPLAGSRMLGSYRSEGSKNSSGSGSVRPPQSPQDSMEDSASITGTVSIIQY